MPGVDGYELLQRVRALGTAQGGDVPAIALTAFARPLDRILALRAGFSVHVSKPVEPSEIVATVASKSIGPGTRKNIDEFTRTTAAAVKSVGGAERGKAIIIVNPAEPPMIMRDTVHCLTVDAPKQKEIEESVREMLAEVQKYVPGYRVMNGPVFDGNRVTTFLQVEGLGDYLPKYAGNLDIMTAAAARTAEMFAEEIIKGRLAPAAA